MEYYMETRASGQDLRDSKSPRERTQAPRPTAQRARCNSVSLL